MISPIRVGANAAICAWPITWATSKQRAATAGSRSTQWSTSATGTTRVCPGVIGLMVRKATTSSWRHTKRPGMSPSMILVKSVGIERAS